MGTRKEEKEGGTEDDSCEALQYEVKCGRKCKDMGEKGTGEGKKGRWNRTGKRKNGGKRRNGGKGGGMEKDIFVLLYQLDLTRTVHSSPLQYGGEDSKG